MTWGMQLVTWATLMSSDASWKKYMSKVKCYQDLLIGIVFSEFCQSGEKGSIEDSKLIIMGRGL